MKFDPFIGNRLFNRAVFGANPADKAMPYLDQLQSMAQEHYNPYIEQGQRVGQNLESAYGNMAANPADFINQLMGQYNPSEGFKMKQDMMGKAMRNTSAAGGYIGTEADNIRQAQLVQGLLGEDMQNWLSNVLGVQGQGLAGQQGMYNLGYDANQHLTDALGTVLGSKADLSFAGQRQKNQWKSDLLKGGVGALGGYLGLGGFGMGAQGALGGLGNAMGMYDNASKNYNPNQYFNRG
jgi:hypothetical protein